MGETFQTIQTSKDIEFFLDQTNELHDGDLIGVQYIHNGHTGGNPHYVNPKLSELRMRYMVTSIDDAIVELVFSSLVEWQVKDNSFEITDTAVSIDENGFVIWTDDCSTAAEVRKNGSYVIAEKMQWRFVDA